MRKLMEECLKEEKIHYLTGPIATGDQFIATAQQKTWIREHFAAIAAEMEGGSIGHVCYINQVPFLILRSISDSEGGAMDYATFAEKAAVQSIEVVIRFIRRAGELSL
jgi:adenosylhomocysteine nucleosidase